jgi:hypothetical protein
LRRWEEGEAVSSGREEVAMAEAGAEVDVNRAIEDWNWKPGWRPPATKMASSFAPLSFIAIPISRCSPSESSLLPPNACCCFSTLTSLDLNALWTKA